MRRDWFVYVGRVARGGWFWRFAQGWQFWRFGRFADLNLEVRE